MKNINKIEQFVEEYSRIIFFLLSIAIFIMFAIVFIQVLFRYIFHFSLFWIEEAARYLLITIAMAGGVLAFKDDTHPKIEIFYNRLNYSLKIKWELFLRFFIIFFLSIIIVVGWNWANLNRCFISSGLGLSYFWPLMAIPIGAFLNLLILLADSLNILINKRSFLIKDKKNKDEIKEIEEKALI